MPFPCPTLRRTGSTLAALALLCLLISLPLTPEPPSWQSGASGLGSEMKLADSPQGLIAAPYQDAEVGDLTVTLHEFQPGPCRDRPSFDLALLSLQVDLKARPASATDLDQARKSALAKFQEYDSATWTGLVRFMSTPTSVHFVERRPPPSRLQLAVLAAAALSVAVLLASALLLVLGRGAERSHPASRIATLVASAMGFFISLGVHPPPFFIGAMPQFVADIDLNRTADGRLLAIPSIRSIVTPGPRPVDFIHVAAGVHPVWTPWPLSPYQQSFDLDASLTLDKAPVPPGSTAAILDGMPAFSLAHDPTFRAWLAAGPIHRTDILWSGVAVNLTRLGLMAIILPCTLLVLADARRWFRRSGIPSHACWNCAYDLRALNFPPACPECGQPITGVRPRWWEDPKPPYRPPPTT